MNNSIFWGILSGVMFGIIISILLVMASNRDKRIKTDYDERQKLIQGKGYKIGFITIAVLLGILLLFDAAGYEFRINRAVIDFLIIAIGGMASVFYCVKHDAYLGLNNNKKRYQIMFLIISLANLGVFFLELASANEKGEFNELCLMNLICGIFLGVLCIFLAIRDARDGAYQNNDAGDDE